VNKQFTRTEFTERSGNVDWTRIAGESASDRTTRSTVAARITHTVVFVCTSSHTRYGKLYHCW